VTGYKKLLHGEAVAMGMCAAAELALRMNIFQQSDSGLIKEMVKRYNLPADIPGDIDVREMMNAMEIDKKAKAGKIRFILPEAIGKVRIEDDVDREVIRKVLKNRT
jgi:3-dehydroquinate synthase